MAGVFDDCKYIPLMSLKPAEMNAIEQLPEVTKDGLLPFFFLKRWSSSHKLISSVGRIEEAIGQRRSIVELGLEQVGTGERRQVHDELDTLRNPSNGYAQWRQFVGDHPSFIPALQLGQIGELAEQASEFEQLGRGLVIRVPTPAFPFISNIAQILATSLDYDAELCFILDFERQDKFLLNKQAEAAAYVQTIRRILPSCSISISASSFPDSFANITAQDIYERLLFEGVRIASADDRLVYSDRGSARAEALGGGGGEIPPRVDYATSTGWSFYRASNANNKLAHYQQQAEAVMDSDEWDAHLHVWGTQLIERTAAGEPNAIYSQATAAAARINIHIHRQQYFGSDDLYDTDEDWAD